MSERLSSLMRDAEKCWAAFERYKETAEQHEFAKLFVADLKIVPAYKDLKSYPDEGHAELFVRAMRKFLKQNFGIEVGGLEVINDED